MKSYILYLISTIIFIPDFIMLYFVRNIIFNFLYISYLLFFMAFIIAIIIMKNYRAYISIAFLSIILILVIMNLKSSINIIFEKNRMGFIKDAIAGIPAMPFTVKMIFTFVFVVIFTSIAAGISSQSFQRLISSFLLSTVILLEQSLIYTYMVIYSISSYLNATIYIEYQNYLSIISLIRHGYQSNLPFAHITMPITHLMMYAFVISIVGSLVWLYLNSDAKNYVLAPFSILAGIIVGYVFFLAFSIFSAYSLQFLFTAIVIAVIFILIGKSNKVQPLMMHLKIKVNI